MRNATPAALLTVALLALGWPTALARGEVAIRELDGRRSIRIELKGATLDEALEALSKRYGFQVHFAGGSGSPQPLFTGLEGEPIALVRRLLRHSNHIVELAADRPIGIARVVVIRPLGGTANQPGSVSPTAVPPGALGPAPHQDQPQHRPPQHDEEEPEGEQQGDQAVRGPPGPPPSEDEEAGNMSDDEPGTNGSDNAD